MSRADTTLDEFLATEESAPEDDESERMLTAADWSPKQPQCECGVAIEEFHSAHEARTMVRIYGDEDSNTVPACPDCVAWNNPANRQHVKTIPHAIKEMDTESTAERKPRRALAIQEAADD